MRTPNILILALVMALGTLALGWWAVPLAAALVAAAAHGRGARIVCRPGRSCAGGAAMAGALAWGALLALAAIRGGERFAAVAHALGGVLGRPAVVVELVTLLLPAVLAWCAATVVEGVMARAFPERAGPTREDDGGSGRRPRVPTPPPVRPPRPLDPADPFAPSPSGPPRGVPREEPELVGAP